MKTNSPSRRNALLRKYKGYSKIFNKLFMLFLLVAFAAGCKKVTEKPGIVGVCPVVVSTDPMDNAIDVVVNKVITATFNTDMDPASISNTSFSIKNGSTPISGTVAPTSNGAAFTFTPDVSLLPFTKYTGTITTVAKDKFRTAMVSDHVWTFTTIPQLSLSSSPVKGGTTSGAGTFAQGSVVTISAVPNAGYAFTNWTDSGSVTVVSTSSSYQYTIAGNRSLVANYIPVTAGNFVVNLSAKPAAGGTTSGGGSFSAGSSVAITATPNVGYSFINWTENGTQVSTSSSFQIIGLAANRTLVANFSAVAASQFAVVLSSNPPLGGTTNGSGAFNAGSSVTISATQNVGYTFINWTDLATGAIASTSSSYTFVLNANKALVANFSANNYSLNVTALNGTVVKNPDQPTYNHGTTVQLTATPKPGYTFKSWSGDATGSANPLTVTMNANKNITANFTIGFSLTVNASNGTVVKNPNQLIYDSLSTVQLTATPNTGYTFTSWSGDASGSANPLSVSMNSNKNITANFMAVTPIIFLGSASNFGALGGNAGITNQGLHTMINNGGIGTTAASSLVTGFHDGITAAVYTETPLNVGDVTGGIYTAPPAPGTSTTFTIAQKALADATIAYNSMSPASKPGGIDPGAGELGGLTLAPGVYKSASGTFKITNLDLVLDAKGDPNATWVFQTAAGLTVGTPTGARSITMINGGQAKNVFWYVGSQAVINYAGGGTMVGTIIANAGVTLSSPANSTTTTATTVLNGRALSLVASVTMVNTIINVQ